MKTGNIIEADRAIAILAPWIKGNEHAVLAFKFDRIKRRLQEDVSAFNAATEKLYSQFGNESVAFTSNQKLPGIDPLPGPENMYLVDSATFDEKYKGIAGITEGKRGKFKIAPENMNAYKDAIGKILDEEVTVLTIDPVPLSLIAKVTIPATDADGKVLPALSDLVIMLREFIKEDI